MSVTSLVTSIKYIANGIATTFAIPFYFIQQQDILVQSIDSSNNVITYQLNADYSITGSPNLMGDYPAGGNIVFNSAPANGLTILIQRITSRVQEVLLVNNSVFTAELLNHVFDKLMLLVQEGFIAGYKGLALGIPTSSSITYNQGDWLKNSSPIPGDVFGWICTTGGNPGVWADLAPISLLA